MTKKQRIIFRRMTLVIIGQIICGVGVGLFLFSGLGPDSNSVFIEGVGSRLGVSYGTSSFILNGLIALIIFFIDRRYVHLASLFVLVTVGFTADFTISVLGSIIAIESSHILIKGLLTALGGLILSIGVVVYTSQDLGMGAFDAMSELTADRTRIEFSKVRRGMDLLMLALGFLLGGHFGIGTVYLAFTTGPIIGLIRNKMGIENLSIKKEAI